MLRDLDRLDLLAQNLNIIAEKAEDPNALFYEAAEAFYSDERFHSLARDIAEDLTTREPFMADNWVLLSKSEMALGHRDEALAAVDYALALDPLSERARLMKAICLIPAPDSREERVDIKAIDSAIAILRDVLTDNPVNSIAVKGLADAYARKGNNAAALEVLEAFMKADKANAYTLLDVMRLHPADPDRFSCCSTRPTAPRSGRGSIWPDRLTPTGIISARRSCSDGTTRVTACARGWSSTSLRSTAHGSSSAISTCSPTAALRANSLRGIVRSLHDGLSAAGRLISHDPRI